jgi:hypothetical protein
MSYNSKTSKLGEIVPKVFARLERSIDQVELTRIIDDYLICAERGGNLEPGMAREERVSFNPRLARILLLLEADGGVRDSLVLRAALYAASPADEACVQQAADIHTGLSELVQEARSSTPSTATAALISGVLELDTVRHIHQTTFSPDERAEMLMHAELMHRRIVQAQAPEWICTKLSHAIALQRRAANS